MQISSGKWALVSSCALLAAGILFFASANDLWISRTSAAEAVTVPKLTDSDKELASKYVNEWERQQRLLAELELLNAESADRVGASAHEESSFLTDMKRVKPELRDQLLPLLEQNLSPVVASTTQANAKLDRSINALLQDLRAVRAALISKRRQLREISAEQRFSGQIANLLNVDNRWLWLCGVISVGSLLALYVHAHRHFFRRQYWVGKYRTIALYSCIGIALLSPLVIPTVLLFLAGNESKDKLVTAAAQDDSLRESEPDAILQMKAGITADTKRRDELLQQDRRIQQDRHRQLANLGKTESKLTDLWVEQRANARHALVQVKLQQDLSAALTHDLEQVRSLDQRLQGERAGIESHAHFSQRTVLGLGLGLLLVTLVGGGVLERSQRQQKKLLAKTCPRCLAVGKLGVADSDVDPNAEFGVTEYECHAVVNIQTDETCGFRFYENYREYPKLCLPTLGVGQSGKTHSVVMSYQQLSLGMGPQEVHFDKLRSSGADKVDAEVRAILDHRMKTMPTEGGTLPHPVLFQFRDNDRWGTSHVLLSIMDYAGGITDRRDIHDAHRQRALRGDGFFFFIDPTKHAESQEKAFSEFREDLQLIRNIKTGKRIHRPVALCVSKIDLLVNADYARGSDVIEAFYSDLRKLDETYRPMSLELIRKRSELVARLRDVIWPHWEIEKKARALFGDRLMFFPMTPVGLNEPGVTDLSKRTIEPYGILEPILWLLHMNGYPVLDD